MDVGRQQFWDENTKKATFVVKADDVVLLASKAGVALTVKGATEWLRDHCGYIEAAIDTAIQDHLLK